MESNNFSDPRSRYLGASRPSKARVQSIHEDAQSFRGRIDSTYNPHYSGRERARKPGKTEKKVLKGIALVAMSGVGLLAATNQSPHNEGSLAHPDQAAITKQANNNENLSKAMAHDANQAQPEQVNQADIERLQSEQAELNRPPAK